MDQVELIRGELDEIVKAVIGPGTVAGGDQAKEEDEKKPFESKGFFMEIAKAEEQLVTGVVLQPEVVDAQGDIMSADVIKEAAYSFLGRFGQSTKLGLQHNSFKNKERRFALAESYVAPIDFVLGTRPVKTGSWIMTWRILDAKLWKQVKDGKITGFSIGGRARAENLKKS